MAKGTVLGKDRESGHWFIVSEADERLRFEIGEWRSEGGPIAGVSVDFIRNGDRAEQLFATGDSDSLMSIGAMHPAKKSIIYGTVSIGLSVIGFMGSILIVVFGPLAIFFGAKGKKIGRGLPDRTGYYLSMTGFILGIVSTVFMALIVIFLLVFIGDKFWFDENIF